MITLQEIINKRAKGMSIRGLHAWLAYHGLKCTWLSHTYTGADGYNGHTFTAYALPIKHGGIWFVELIGHEQCTYRPIYTSQPEELINEFITNGEVTAI